MCHPASMIVCQGPKVFCSKKSHRHNSIRMEHGLPDNDRVIHNVQIELLPPAEDFNADPETWIFVVDQDMLPQWWDHEAAEAACRRELPAWIKHWVIGRGQTRNLEPGETAILCGGHVPWNRGHLTHAIKGTIELNAGDISYCRDVVINNMSGGRVSGPCFGTQFIGVSGGVIASLGDRSCIGTITNAVVEHAYTGACIVRLGDGARVGYCDGTSICSMHPNSEVSVVAGGDIARVYDGARLPLVTGGSVRNCRAQVGRVSGGRVDYCGADADVRARATAVTAWGLVTTPAGVLVYGPEFTQPQPAQALAAEAPATEAPATEAPATAASGSVAM